MSKGEFLSAGTQIPKTNPLHRYDAASVLSSVAPSAGAASAGRSLGFARSGAGLAWPKSLFLIFLSSVATRSLGVAPTDIQYSMRSILILTRSDLTFTIGS